MWIVGVAEVGGAADAGGDAGGQDAFLDAVLAKVAFAGIADGRTAFPFGSVLATAVFKIAQPPVIVGDAPDAD